MLRKKASSDMFLFATDTSSDFVGAARGTVITEIRPV